MGDVSEEALLDYFYSTGGTSGKVKNADMLKTFKNFIGHSDLQLRAKYREEFKLIIDQIAVVKSENGEKYLILKKKYRQHNGTDVDAKAHQSPARTTATARWDVPEVSPPQEKQQQEEPMSSGEPGSAAEEPSTTSHEGDELDKDSGDFFTHQVVLSKLPGFVAHRAEFEWEEKQQWEKASESEQDEEGTGSVGSPAVTLDPIEKDWIYSAAGARVPDLSQLLRQDPLLANKKDFTSGFTALHWAAKHGNKDMATLVANAGADVNTKSGYTPLHIAALHGHRHIVDLLIDTYGAKENLRDYSGHVAYYYLNIKEPEVPEDDCDLQFQVTQARERNKNRKLVSLFHSKKKWGSAEELAPIEEERTAAHQLALPPFRPRKFSR